MEIRNFLFLLMLAGALGACSSIDQRRAGKPVVITSQSQQSSGKTEPTPIVAEPIAPQPGAVLPVGVYLGPGLMRSYVHIGILKVLSQAQIPIVAIGGEEWGGIVAALYAFSKSGNDVEWQMLKLRKDQIPSTGGFLRGSETQTKDSAHLLNFLKFIFADKNLNQVKVPFGCSACMGYQLKFLTSGPAAEELLKCSALPPFYTPAFRSWISGSVASSAAWAEQMNKQGARFLIYVDIMGDGEMLSKSKLTKSDEAIAVLTAVKSASEQNYQRAQLVMKVPVSEDILNFEARRELIKLGENFARGILPEVMKQIGLSQ